MPLNKKNLTGLIKDILKEEFAKQEKNISNLINGDFEITMKEEDEKIPRRNKRPQKRNN